MALGLSPGMVSNALAAYQSRIAQEQAKKQNLAAGISQFGRSVAGGISAANDREAAAKAAQLEQAQREMELGARERLQSQAQQFQAQQAREEANRARIDQMLEEARQQRQSDRTAQAYRAAGVNLPSEAKGLPSSALGPLAGAVMAQEGAGQFGKLVAPVPKMPLMNPLGFPGVPESIGGGPATTQSVAMRAGSMQNVNPEMAKRAMEFVAAANPATKPTAQKPFWHTPEGYAEKAGIDAANRPAPAPPKPVDPLVQEERRLRIERMKAEIERAMRAQPEMDQNTKNQLSVLSNELRSLDPIVHQEQIQDVLRRQRRLLGLPEDGSVAPPSAPPAPAQSAPPAPGGDQPSPEDVEFAKSQGYRWDAARGAFVK